VTIISSTQLGPPLISLAPLAGRGRGEGLTFEAGQEGLENPGKIVDDIVVPDVDHAVAKGAQPTVALLVCSTLRVLATVEFDDQAPLAANEVDIVSIDGLLADELEPASCRPRMRVHNANSAAVSPRRNDRARSVRLWSLPCSAATLLVEGFAPHPNPLPARRGEGVT